MDTDARIRKFRHFFEFCFKQLDDAKVTFTEIQQKKEAFYQEFWNAAFNADAADQKGDLRAIDTSLTDAKKALMQAIADINRERNQGAKP